MNLSKKQKSNFVFYGLMAGFFIFLFFTPWGKNLKDWVTSLTLSNPDMEQTIPTSDAYISKDWLLVKDDGSEILLSKIDKPIFLNIWATWCGPCRSEMSAIEDLHEIYGSEVEFLLVSPTEGLEIIKKFKSSRGDKMNLYVNGSQIPQVLYGGVFPTTFIISKEKEIVLKSEGAHDWNTNEVHQFLDNLLQK